MQTEKTPASQQNNNIDVLPTLYIDGANVHSRKDGMYYLKLTANLPDGVNEQARIMINDAPLRRIIDVLCNITHYYPDNSKKENQPLTPSFPPLPPPLKK